MDKAFDLCSYTNYVHEHSLMGWQRFKQQEFDTRSYIEKFLNFWFIAVARSPITPLAPKLLLIMAVLLATLPFCALIFLDPSLAQPVPSWVYFMSAFGVFMYQTLDNAHKRQEVQANEIFNPSGMMINLVCESQMEGFFMQQTFSLATFTSNHVDIIMYITYTGLYISRWYDYYDKDHNDGFYTISATPKNCRQQWLHIVFLTAIGYFGKNWLTYSIKDVLTLSGFAKYSHWVWGGNNSFIETIILLYAFYTLNRTIFDRGQLPLKATWNLFRLSKQLAPLGVIQQSSSWLFEIEELSIFKGYMYIAVGNYVLLVLSKMSFDLVFDGPKRFDTELFLLFILSFFAKETEDLQTKKLILMTILASGFILLGLFFNEVKNWLWYLYLKL